MNSMQYYVRTYTTHTYICICTYNITKSGHYCYTKYILKMKEHVGMSKPKAMNNKEKKNGGI